MKTTLLLSTSLLLGCLHCFAEPESEAVVKPEATAEDTAKEPVAPKPSILTFADKSRITGFAKGIDSTKSELTLESPSLLDETRLKTDQLLELTLNGTPQEIESDHYVLATIKKHFRDPHMDTIRGRLVALDDDTITLETWYAGQLTLKRSMVQSLDIFGQAPSFYNGPNGPEGWVAAGGDLDKYWTFKNRSMISKDRSGIARKIEIPEKAKITFTADWRSSPYFRILLFSNDGSQDYPGTGYSLNVNRTYLTLYRNVDNGRNNGVISESIRNLINAESAEFTIYLDRSKQGTNAVYIDDQEIGNWTGVDDTVLNGEWIHFIPQNPTPMKFSNISVAQWDGQLPTKPEEAKDADNGVPKPAALPGQKIHLANGDVIIGTVSTIDDGMAKLKTGFGDIGVPVRLMRSVALPEIEDQVRMETNDVRAWFHEGGYVTIKLKSLDEKTIKGYSQVWGDAEFDLNAFSRIEFNIWEQDLNALRYETGSDW